MKKGAKTKIDLLPSSIVIVILLTAFVIATDPSWNITFPHIPVNFAEDRSPVFIYNFSANVSNPDNVTLTFAFQTLGGGNPIVSDSHNFDNATDYYWISIDSTTGVMVLNATLDNETAQFNISVDVIYPVQQSIGAKTFFFVVNATNDAPNFTSIQTEYNLTQDQNFLDYINATDEESHHPLIFNISFPSCTLASFSTRTNCSLLTFTNVSNTSVLMNYTPVRNDAGVYQANISVMDAVENYACTEVHCAANYNTTNATTYYSQLINFTVFATVTVNITDCQNSVFQENSANTCQINITSRDADDVLNITSLASLRNTGGISVSNTSWFFADNITNAVNFSKTITINVTPQKTEIGNWTINFTVEDLTFGLNTTEQIFIFVNRTNNDVPAFAQISNRNVSTNQTILINITTYDDDFLIPDKNDTHGGFNETLTLNVSVLNQSDLSQELSLSGFDIEILSMPVSSTNRTEAKIEFTPNSSEVGDYTINLSATDKDNSTTLLYFNLSIFSNNAPSWNETLPNISVVQDYEGNNTYLNLSQNVSDPDGDTLNFSFTNDSRFDAFVSGFNLTAGIVNFTPADVDVGYHNITITVSDGFLTDDHEFNFTILNINDVPSITGFTTTNATPSSVSNGDLITIQEDNATQFTFFVEDNDFCIPSSQKSFYNETITINLTIQGPNPNLFSITNGGSSFPVPVTSCSLAAEKRDDFIAVFTPNKTDVGNYNISINATDSSNSSSTWNLNLTILSVDHAPTLSEIGFINTSVVETLYIDVNATDIEDVNETASFSNMTFTITNLTSGGNFLTINSTTGVINFTLNQTYAGIWSYNISVNDSAGLTDSEITNISVYDYPVILLPNSAFIFNLVENVSSQLNFTLNHTIQDTLNYTLIINNLTRNSTLGYGNGTEFLWNFTANFTDETTCQTGVLLTLNVTNAKLSNSTSWNVTINHTNHPLQFTSSINDISSGSPASITLSNRFTDIDASDTCRNQTIGFVENLLGGNTQTIKIINWTNANTPNITFSSASDTTANYTITAYELNSSSAIIGNVTSNNFTVTLTVTTTSTTTSSGGGGGGGGTTTVIEPVSLKITVPEPATAKRGDRLLVPVGLYNDGTTELNEIFLSLEVLKNTTPEGGIVASLDKDFILLMPAGSKQNLTMTVDVQTSVPGIYEILIKANVTSPIYSTSESFFIKIEEENLLEKIIFTEELIVGNPECAELKELVDEARNLYVLKDFEGANAKIEEVLEACKKAISQPVLSEGRLQSRIEENLFSYVSIASLVAFALGFGYYQYKKFRFRRSLKKQNSLPISPGK